MSYELMAILLLFLALMIIAAEFLWLFILAERQESHTKKYSEASRQIDAAFDAVLYAPTGESRKEEIAALAEFVGDNPLKMDILSGKILGVLMDGASEEERLEAAVAVNDAVKPLDFYARLLHEGGTYQKAYACRKVAAFYGEKEIPVIRELAFSRNRDLAYNAAMALSAFGDEDTVVRFILDGEKDARYSHRIILELIMTYTGDLRSLASRLFEQGGDYIKATVIKGLSDYRFPEFEPIYIDGLSSTNINLKIACIRALGRLGKPEYEHALIIAAHDKTWTVRAAAVTELGRMTTPNAADALTEATGDPEWWVRYNAAKALVAADPDLTHVEAVLKGYDKYAADAVKYALYRNYRLTGE